MLENPRAPARVVSTVHRSATAQISYSVSHNFCLRHRITSNSYFWFLVIYVDTNLKNNLLPQAFDFRFVVFIALYFVDALNVFRIIATSVLIEYHSKLENVAINDVLPLRAARRDAIANFKCFGAQNTSDRISMVSMV